MTARVIAIGIIFCLLSLLVRAQSEWQVVTSGLDTNLRGVSTAVFKDARGIVGEAVWASGSNGVILRSLDSGKSWERLHIAGGEALDFRGVVADGARIAYVMSSGSGDKSRIYKTSDGGKSWKLQYTDKHQEFFLDSIACESQKKCVALSDPVNGKFLLLETTNRQHWKPLPADNMPAALPGEGAFAASNSCLALQGSDIFFGTGGPAARVFHSPDFGRTWTVAEIPIAHGNPSSGIFSITVRRAGSVTDLVAVGGDYQKPQQAAGVSAVSFDAGKSWQLSAQQPGGYRSAVAGYMTVGPTGEDISDNAGFDWKPAGSLSLNAITATRAGMWAAGPHGTVARLWAMGRE